VYALDRKKVVVEASQPAFKPRKVNQEKEARYRDRAAERRVGEGNDYAEVKGCEVSQPSFLT
jgi:hypothetical protein